MKHWILAASFSLLILLTGIIWTDIKSDYRSEYENIQYSKQAKLELVFTLGMNWFDSDMSEKLINIDTLVDRLWAIYFPALAIEKVPSVLPYEEGEILLNALKHILMPRFLFPDKPRLPSDSQMVRKYSGVWVAGEEEGTSIAFGYAAESYIDFGVPLMFVPIFIYGLIMGVAYKWFERKVHYRNIGTATLTIVFWLSLYLFERSWIKMLGFSFTLLIYLGGSTILLDRYLWGRRSHARISSRKRLRIRW